MTAQAQPDHRAALASLDMGTKRQLTTKSNRPAAFRLAMHVGTLGLALVGIALGVPYWPVLLLPAGILMVFLFTLMHEATHRTAFENGRVNDGVAMVCGLVLFLPPAWFRYFHFAHHRHTQDPERDPELASAKPDTRLRYWLHVSGLPVWTSQIKALIRNAIWGAEDAFVPEAAQGLVRLEARLMLVIYGAAAVLSYGAGSTLLVWCWIVPLLLGQPFLRLYLLAEHGNCPLVENMLANSRTTLTNRVVCWIAWNMPYHAEHHAWPIVPFHQLPHLHDHLREHLGQVERGYTTFNRSYFERLR